MAFFLFERNYRHMNANKDPAPQEDNDPSTSEEDPLSLSPRTYDCATCRFIYDERTGLCSVCIRKILDTHTAQKQKRTA